MLATTGPKLGRLEKYGYSTGALGGGLAFNLVRAFFMIYCTDVLGVSAGFLAVMFFVARLFDAFTDPVVGTLSENIRTRWGKHKPWVAIGAVLNALVAVAMFSPWLSGIQNQTTLLAAVTVLYVLFGITYTIIDVPYYAYAASFTNLKERDAISVMPRLIGGVAMIGVPALTLGMVERFGGGSAVQGYFRWALILMVIYVVFAMIAAKSMKIREVARREKPLSFREAFRTLRTNDQLMIIVTVFVLGMTAVSITQSVALFYFLHVWQAPGAYETFMLMAGAGMGIALLLYSFLAKKISRRAIFLLSMILPAAGYPVMFVIAQLAPTPYWMLPLVLTTVGGFGFQGIIHSIFMVDTVEYGEWKQGYRSENLVFSLLTLIGKFSGAFAALITMGALHFAGYVSTREGGILGELAAETAEVITQPASVNITLSLLMFVVPPFILVLALWLYLKKYKLQGEFLEKISRELEEKRVATI